MTRLKHALSSRLDRLPAGLRRLCSWSFGLPARAASGRRRRLRRSAHLLRAAGLAVLALAVQCRSAYADLGVVVDDPTTVGVSWFTHSGHSLVYLSNVCAATPVHARLCRPGESGSVISMYPDFRENKDYAWNMVPFQFYLQGLQTPGDRLLYGSASVKAALELHARINALERVCGDHACPQQPHAFWRDMVGATVDRDMFVYAVHTTRNQDDAIVAWLNRLPNHNHYNSMTNNCSNFTASLVNMVFPHSVHRDWLNDLGMMSPKGAARSFTRWAAKRPELGLYTLHYAQQPGPVPRGGVARSGTEDGFHMKKYLIPAALIGDHEVAGSFFVAYYLTGRFGLYKQYAKYARPSPLQSAAVASPGSAVERVDFNPTRVSASQNPVTGRAVVGTREEWAQYRLEFAAILASAPGAWKPDHKHLFPRSFASGRVWVDAAGQPFLTIGSGGSAQTVGMSSEDIFAPGSDPQLARQLMLGRVEYQLTAKNHYRESILAFRRDWALLQHAMQGPSANPADPAAGSALPAIAAQR